MARNTPQEQHIFDPGSRTDVMSNQISLCWSTRAVRWHAWLDIKTKPRKAAVYWNLLRMDLEPLSYIGSHFGDNLMRRIITLEIDFGSS